MSDWVTVARTEDLPPGESRCVDVDGTRVAVFNLNGQYHAIEDVCTHDGGLLTDGRVEGDQVICSRHGARFSITTGEALCAPAYEPTAVFPVRIENGEVQVRDDRWE
ncbi:MAG TPA: non-heme iron oxygenase ferredoxin subunit [Burkholderiales bacterium]|nr:non-heme iron oxygenase ferredoxin subunit [Burkholderiales bacterium]